MGFIIGIILFIPIIGWLDRRLPWPVRRRTGATP